MEDLPIHRVLPTNGIQRIVHSKEGEIVVLFRGDLVVLTPQSNSKHASSSISNKLSDHFTMLKLTGSLNKNDNVLRNYLALESNKIIGESRQHSITNGVKITGISISDSGISISKSSMMLIVTDTMNGLLVKFEEGSVTTVCVINNKIMKLEDINTENVISNWELKKLRLMSLVWLKGLDYGKIDTNLWPMIPGSLFICISQNDTCHIYQFNDVNETVQRILQFSLGVDENEWGVSCDVSEWSYKNFKETSIIHSFITVLTNCNRIIVKKVTYQISNNEITIESLPYDTNDIVGPIVMNLSIKTAQGEILLVTFFSNCVNIVELEKGMTYSIPINSHILIESMTYFYDCEDSSVVHLIFTNTFGYLGHLTFSTSEEKYDLKEHNYFMGITDDKFPLSDKLNKLNSENKEKYVIDSLSTDPTHKFIEFTYYSINFTTKIDFLSVKRDPIMFSIVKTQEHAKLDFDDIRLFNSLQASPSYVKSMSQLQNELNQHDSTYKKPEPVVDPKVKLEEAGDQDEKDFVDIDDGVLHKGISETMFLNHKLEKLRIDNSKNGSVLTRETRLVILKKLARQVVEMVQRGELHTSSEHDMLMFLQFCSLLGENKVADTVCTLPIENFNGMEQSFCASKFTFKHEDGLPLTIESLEGNSWSVCEITMLPILSGKARSCLNCGCKCVAEPEGRLCSAILNSVPICIYCGGRFAL